MSYGNIRAVETTGASWQTSQQDRLGYSGVRASHTMAETDAGRMERYKSKIKRVGAKYNIDPALIAAIISRESRAGNALTDGWGDHGNAWGLMQVDVNPRGGNHTPVGEWDSEEHLCQATKILVDFIKLIQRKPAFSGLSKEKQLKGGIAAYNMGDGKVHSYEGVDENTTGKDYSNDVVARAQWYKAHGVMYWTLAGYGNIMDVETTGASQKTANSDRLSYAGVRASRTMAKTDADRMKKYKSKIKRVGAKYNIDPALIAAIISRESRAGNALTDGWGDYSYERRAWNAWGLMQVDVNPEGGNHTPEGEWDSEEHLCQATKILVDFIEAIQNKGKFRCLSKEKQLKGGIAAYNMGDGNVHSYERVDENTTGEDYSNDVVARAQWYKEHGDF
ncbi:uncharacterized protein LOC121604548 [Chelmon rostratus]|uniref:uncharacterized protein LOC121604548 n=1 Tax=Chelmon rostratus TaxID=109905 RepID=UPI001BE51AD5|nr:uncharacterized protein LOC121604548 [Chelmon rostratus]